MYGFHTEVQNIPKSGCIRHFRPRATARIFEEDVQQYDEWQDVSIFMSGLAAGHWLR